MKVFTHISLLLAIVLCSLKGLGQEYTAALGIQLKPLIPSELIGAGTQEVSQSDVNFSIGPASGYTFGMVIRKGITDLISIETGINYTKRNFQLTIADDSTQFSGTSTFRMINYQIPLQLLVYVKLGRQLYMNVAGGGAIAIYPSDLYTEGDYFINSLVKRRAFQPGLVANVGWEYRTSKSGSFYLGASYHRPFSYVATDYAEYRLRDGEVGGFFELSGDYLTVDLRYFFPPESTKKK